MKKFKKTFTNSDTAITLYHKLKKIKTASAEILLDSGKWTVLCAVSPEYAEDVRELFKAC